jgi:hypothetical protein
LGHLFHAANLKVSDVQMFSIVETSYDPTGYGASVIGITGSQLSSKGFLLQMWKPGKQIYGRAQQKVSGFFA